MKLIRFGKAGQEKPGIIANDGSFKDVSHLVNDYDERFFGEGGLEKLNTQLKESNNLQDIPSDARIGAPLARPSKIVCVGLNYAKHAAESGMDIPSSPVLFMKASSSLVGPYDDVIIPRNSQKTDWEVELAIVIGKKATYVSEENASDHIAGFVLHNDVSERAFQLEQGGQWVKGKSNDTFAPVGPFIATKDEIADPHTLNLWLKVNGEMLQNSDTSDMIFKVPYLVSYISQYMSLLPGDIISTGTPFGVGLGFNPPKYLKEGDIMELGIDGLGSSKQHVKNYKS